jgi:hypothetical protein
VKIRTGARTYLRIIQKACRLSHISGFRTGVSDIIGPTNATALFELWDPFCTFVDILVAGDNWFNQIDARDDASGFEDVGPA